jgi:hypothetical protein
MAALAVATPRCDYGGYVRAHPDRHVQSVVGRDDSVGTTSH